MFYNNYQIIIEMRSCVAVCPLKMSWKFHAVAFTFRADAFFIFSKQVVFLESLIFE